MYKSFFLAGGAGFIGSHMVDALLQQEVVEKVTIYDNFSNGKTAHYQHHGHDKRLSVVKGEIAFAKQLTEAMQDHEVVIHLASNADIAKAVQNPSIDFTEGMLLTYQILEAARLTGVKRLLYTSGSGVYGDMGEVASVEDQGNLHPVSTYGASKLAGEAFISSYCHMFGLTACVFRFANVVGARQTHGVGYDFVNRLFENASVLSILGDGSQSKSYVHVHDVVRAVFLANEKMESKFDVYNVGTDDYLTVEEIANIVIDGMELTHRVRFEFTGGSRGWRGDVPIVRLNSKKIRALGWQPNHSSKQAIYQSVLAMIAQKRLETCV